MVVRIGGPLIGLSKQSLYKSIGKSLLTWSNLEEVLLGVEVNLKIDH